MFDFLSADSIKTFVAGMLAGRVLSGLYEYLNTKFIVYITNQISLYIDKAFFIGDDLDDEWLVFTCINIEKRMERQFPGQKKGSEKFIQVAEMLISKLKPILPIYLRPFLNIDNEKIKEIIEKAVLKMRETIEYKIALNLKHEYILDLYNRLNKEEQIKFLNIIKEKCIDTLTIE